MRHAGVSLQQAIDMAAQSPARLLGIEPGGLTPGDPADLVLFDLRERFEVRATVVAGELVFGDPSSGTIGDHGSCKCGDSH